MGAIPKTNIPVLYLLVTKFTTWLASKNLFRLMTSPLGSCTFGGMNSLDSW